MQRIFLGDVQGCADELDTLLDRAGAEFGEAFELWVVGDLINRGPDNLRPLARIRALVDAGRAHYVLGNHELHLIRSWLGVRPLTPLDTFGDVLDSADVEDWIDWLLRRPLVEAEILGDQHFAMVHASTHPDWSLDDLLGAARRAEARLRGSRDGLRMLLAGDGSPEADVLGRLTRCRAVTPDGRWSAEPPLPPERAWHEAWSERGHTYGVVYGHWSLQGLHVGAGLRGLDTGCVHHGRGRDGALTAWVPDPSAARPFDAPDRAFWSTPARRAYYAFRDGPDPGSV